MPENVTHDVSQYVHFTPGDKRFLAGIIIGSLLVSIGFVLGTTVFRYGFPATVVAFLLGLALATLSYAYLGGVRGNEVRIGGIKLVGTVAVVVAILYFLPGPLRSEMHDIDLIEKGRNAEALIKAADERANRQLVVERNVPQPIIGGGRIQLEDVNTLNGWNEGPHAENQRRPDRDFIFRKLFQRLDIQRPVAEVIGMTEQQWQGFLTELPQGKRLQLGGIPFATLTVQASDGRSHRMIVFKNDANLPVVNRGNQTEAFLCIRRVMDVRERRSDEPEIIVLTHSRERCQ